MYVPELVGLVVVAGVYLLGPKTLELRTKTEARSMPLTDSNVKTKGATVNAEGVLVAAVLLRRIGGVEISASLNEPVSTEGVGDNLVLVHGNFSSALCCSIHSETYECERNH